MLDAQKFVNNSVQHKSVGMDEMEWHCRRLEEWKLIILQHVLVTCYADAWRHCGLIAIGKEHSWILFSGLWPSFLPVLCSVSMLCEWMCLKFLNWKMEHHLHNWKKFVDLQSNRLIAIDFLVELQCPNLKATDYQAVLFPSCVHNYTIKHWDSH